MNVDVIIEDPRWQGANLPALARRGATAALAHLGHDPDGFDIAVLACDDARIALLNGDFRGKAAATNVLSWPSEDRAADLPGGLPQPPVDTELGDIAIAHDTCLREAREQGLSLDDHVTHLIVHGVLHLLGYDHVRDQDATLMEGLETAILGKLGIRDPYRNDTGV